MYGQDPGSQEIVIQNPSAAKDLRNGFVSEDRSLLPSGIYRFLDSRHTFLKSLPSNNDEFQSNRTTVQGDEKSASESFHPFR